MYQPYSPKGKEQRELTNKKRVSSQNARKLMQKNKKHTQNGLFGDNDN